MEPIQVISHEVSEPGGVGGGTMRGWQGCEPDTEEAERDRDKRGKKERRKGGQEMGTVTGEAGKGDRWEEVGWRD